MVRVECGLLSLGEAHGRLLRISKNRPFRCVDPENRRRTAYVRGRGDRASATSVRERAQIVSDSLGRVDGRDVSCGNECSVSGSAETLEAWCGRCA